LTLETIGEAEARFLGLRSLGYGRRTIRAAHELALLLASEGRSPAAASVLEGALEHGTEAVEEEARRTACDKAAYDLALILIGLGDIERALKALALISPSHPHYGSLAAADRTLIACGRRDGESARLAYRLCSRDPRFALPKPKRPRRRAYRPRYAASHHEQGVRLARRGAYDEARANLLDSANRGSVKAQYNAGVLDWREALTVEARRRDVLKLVNPLRSTPALEASEAVLRAERDRLLVSAASAWRAAVASRDCRYGLRAASNLVLLLANEGLVPLPPFDPSKQQLQALKERQKEIVSVVQQVCRQYGTSSAKTLLGLATNLAWGVTNGYQVPAIARIVYEAVMNLDDLNASSQARVDLAWHILNESGAVQAAVQVLEGELARPPELRSQAAAELLGWLMIVLRGDPSARAVYEAAWGQSHQPRAQCRLGLAIAASGDSAGAEELFSRARAGCDLHARSRANYSLGLISSGKGDLRTASGYFEEVAGSDDRLSTSAAYNLRLLRPASRH
jgi:hypothetical protein